MSQPLDCKLTSKITLGILLLTFFWQFFAPVATVVWADQLPQPEIKALAEYPNWVGLCGSEFDNGSTDVATIPDTYTLKNKIGRLLFVSLADASQAASMEKKYEIGGFLFDSGSAYSKSTADSIKSAGKLTPLIAVDEEGGQVQRLKSAIGTYPSAKKLGLISDDDVQKSAADMGKKMAERGINIDLAPVLDLDNGKNTAISKADRSFSSKPEVVTSKANAFADGLNQAGIIPAFKHFPGLGNATGSTGGNTDTGLATTPDLATLVNKDLKPYESLLGSGRQSIVMMGNQIVPGLTGNDPASMSNAAYELLRSKYKYNGVVVTDEIGNAKAVKPRSPSDAVIAAMKAGADMPLFIASGEQQISSVINDVEKAVNDGTLSKSRIDLSINKVLQLIKPKADAPASCCPGNNGGNAGSTTLSGKDNEEKIFNYFVSKGLSPVQSAAIVGNIQQESSFNPIEIEGGGTSKDPSASGTGGWGLTQWTPGSKVNGIAKRLKVTGPIYELATQLDIIWGEMGTVTPVGYSNFTKDYKKITDLAKATDFFTTNYEGAGIIGPRTAFATAALKKYGKNTPGAQSGPSSSACPSNSDSGVGGYKNPYRDLKQSMPLRIDMGVDYAGKGPIYAIGKGKVDVVYEFKSGGGSGWPGRPSWPNDGGGGGYVSYTLSEGPAKGKTVYMSEACQPTVKHGDELTADTKICDMDGVPGKAGDPWSEMGWAANKTGTTAKAWPVWKDHDDLDHYTAYGENFSQLLQKLGAKPGTKQAGAVKLGSLESGWPSW